MDKYYTQTVGLPVLAESGHKIGRVFDVILNTDTGKVAAFMIAPSGPNLIAPVDILDWNNSLIIHDSDDILEIDELHQAKEALKKNIRIYKNKVVSKSGHYLGRAVDFAIHEKFFTLTKILVAKNVLGIFLYSKRIINSKDIIEIKKDHIIVKDPIGLIPVKKTVPLKKLSIDAAPTS